MRALLQVAMLSHANCQVVHRCKRMPVYAINAQDNSRSHFTFPIYKWNAFYSFYGKFCYLELPARAAGGTWIHFLKQRLNA